MDPSRWQNLGYLFWAYTFFWGLLAVYLVSLSRRLTRVRRELDALRGERAPARPKTAP
ncbi:MAG: CcmD family protein [Acidobacteriota bacterium]